MRWMAPCQVLKKKFEKSDRVPKRMDAAVLVRVHALDWDRTYRKPESGRLEQNFRLDLKPGGAKLHFFHDPPFQGPVTALAVRNPLSGDGRKDP